jgi:hypothetical protein
MQPAASVKRYRIVVASPGDVQEERDLVQSAVDEVNRTLDLARSDVILTVSRLETDVYPGFHPEGPQGRVEEDLDIENCEILIGIFWKRFGSPVRGAASGTEHEIRKALSAQRQRGRPQVMLYFCDRQCRPETPEEADQVQKVKLFKAEMQQLGLYHCYGPPDEFGEKLRQHLTQYSFRVLAATGDSNAPDNSEFQLQASATVSSVRAEGLAEPLGEITLTQQGTMTDPTGLPHAVDVRVFTNVNLTNRLLAGDLTDAILVRYPPGAQSSVRLGRLAGANCIVFEGIPLRSGAGTGPGTFRILNLRGHANLLGWRGDHEPIQAYVQVDGIKVRDPQQTVAEIGMGLRFEVLDADGGAVPADEPAARLLQYRSERRRVVTLRYREGMPVAFRCKAPDPRQLHSALADHGFFESACFGLPVQAEDGACLVTGMADCGTQLVAVFANVPSGLRLLVSPTEVRASSGLGARLLQGSSILRPETDESQDSFEVARAVEVQLNMGTGMIAWEVVARDTPDPGFLDFAVYVVYSAQPDLGLPGLGTATVNGFLGPISTVTTAGAGPPVPRFADTSRGRHLFRIYRQ